jgi:hypothetical protein
MNTEKQPGRDALSLLRRVPEGPERIKVLKRAQLIASRHIFINIRGSDVESAMRQISKEDNARLWMAATQALAQLERHDRGTADAIRMEFKDILKRR